MQSDVHHAVLESVRRQRKLPLDQVAVAARIPADRLYAIEAGLQSPSRKQLERLASIYGLPLYALYAESAPTLAENPADYRRADAGPAALSPAGLGTLLRAERTSTYSYMLQGVIEQKFLDFLSETRKINDVDRLAKEVRRRFDVWRNARLTGLRLSGSAEQVFFQALRIFLEVQGFIVMNNDAPISDYLGFFIKPDEALPAIFINRKLSSKKAQLFTLVHELAHVVYQSEGVSNPFQLTHQTERLCNAFAAEFLAPKDEFQKVVERQSAVVRASPDDFIGNVSRETLLSRQATAIRLLETKHLPPTQFSVWYANWNKMLTQKIKIEAEPESEGSFGQPHAKRVGELGYLSVYLSYRAFSDKIIDRYDVENGLGLSSTLQDRAFSLAARRYEVGAA